MCAGALPLGRWLSAATSGGRCAGAEGVFTPGPAHLLGADRKEWKGGVRLDAQVCMAALPLSEGTVLENVPVTPSDAGLPGNAEPAGPREGSAALSGEAEPPGGALVSGGMAEILESTASLESGSAGEASLLPENGASQEAAAYMAAAAYHLECISNMAAVTMAGTGILTGVLLALIFSRYFRA